MAGEQVRKEQSTLHERSARRQRSAHRAGTALALVWLLLPMTARAAQPVPLERDFTIRVWRKEHGLPDDRVLSLLEDRRGFMWMGTRKGVSRFDGSRFVTWSRSTHAAFVDEKCRALAQDAAGQVWVGTERGLIRLGDPPVRFDVAELQRDGTPNPRFQVAEVHSLLGTDAGELLVGTHAGLLIGQTDGAWRWAGDQSGLQASDFQALCLAPDGRAWAGTTYQLFRREPSGEAWTPEFGVPADDGTQCVHALALTPTGEVHAVVGSFQGQSGRLLRRDAVGWSPVLDRVLSNYSHPPYLLADSQGALWFPLEEQKIGCWRGGGLTEYELPLAITGPAFLCLAEDAEGNLWAGTSQHGLLCLLPRRIRTLTLDDGLPHLTTRALLEASDGTLWVATDGGAVQFGPGGPRVLTQEFGLASNMVRALAEDARGGVWIGTGGGLSRWNGEALEPVEFAGPQFRNKLRALHEARDGAVWAGTAQGLYRFGPDQTNAWLVADGLPHESVCALHQDRHGQLWIGTDGGGLARFTGSALERVSESHGLSSSRVYALADDPEGALWIGTDRGLNVLRGDRLSTLTTAQGLPDNLVNGIIPDASGWLWVGHDRGIYRAERKELIQVADGHRPQVRCVAYTEEDGLLHLETNGQNSYPPALRLRDGRIAFATMGGVALFDPVVPPDLTNGPTAHIESLLAGGRTIADGMGASTMGDGAEGGRIARWVIPPADRGLLSLHFSAVAFRAPERVKFRYRLLGLSPAWTDAGALRQATFAGLPPGEYTFEVIAVNHRGTPSTVPARLGFRLEPHWHERRWVRAFGVLLAGAMLSLVGARRWRELRRVHRLEQQAVLARERARLAKDLHDGLGSSLTEITLLSGLGETPQPLSPEAVAARFDRLARRTHEALHSLRDLIWTTNPQADSLEVLVSHLCESTERTLEAAGLRCRLDFPAELPAVTLGSEFRRQLALATKEAVQNAVRHARATQVTLKVAVDEAVRPGGVRLLLIQVSDDGCGFNVKAQEQRPAGPVHGLGLASLRERLASLGGQCEIQSSPGRGTCVSFRLPIGDSS